MRDRTIESLHPRVAATFALIPLTFGIVTAAYFLVAEVWQSAAFWVIACCVVLGPAVVFYGGALIIWCPTVRWTRRKVIGTVVNTLAFVSSIAAVGGAAALWLHVYAAFAFMLIASLLLGPVALLALSWICWTPPAEREASCSVPCPKCGFDLRAQQECRCPECGFTFLVGHIVPIVRPDDTAAKSAS